MIKRIFAKPQEKKPEDVFTPRSAVVNDLMYMHRPAHERALRIGMQTGYNLVIYGDSGCGKSWLYKRVFDSDNVFYETIDFAKVGTVDDVDFAILDLVNRGEYWIEEEYRSSESYDFKPSRIGAGEGNETLFRRVKSEPYLQLLEKMRLEAGKRRTYLVFENLEFVLDNQDVINYIQTMLLSLDNEQTGQLNIRICLVGVPSEISEILSKGNRHQTISNRVYEIPELDRLDRPSTDLLIVRGLEQELDFEIEAKNVCCGLIAFYTYRIPQYIHDVCLHAAILAAENQGIIDQETVEDAVEQWVFSNSKQSLEFIKRLISSDRSRNAIKIKTLYALSRLETQTFNAEQVTEEIRKNFPISIGGARVQTLRHIRSMSEGNEKVLKCDQDRVEFRFATPHLRSALRKCLKILDKTETVVVVGS